MKNKKQFTLIELIIVIVVIGILAAMALPKFTGVIRDAKLAAMINDKEVLEKTLILYNQKHDNLPLLNEDQELIVKNEGISLNKIVLAEEVKSNDMETIYKSLKETLSHYNDSEDSLYRIDLSKANDNLNKKLKYGYKKHDKDFYVYSIKTNNIYYYDYLINGNGTIQHSEYDTLLKENELINKIKSPYLNNDGIQANNKPIVNLVTDLENITTDTNIKWEYKFIDEDKEPTKISFILNNIEYDSFDKIPTKLENGEYTIKLKMQDSKRFWSEEITRSFKVEKKIIVEKNNLALGTLHSIKIGNDGKLYSWGYNDCGQLGLGSTIEKVTPQLVTIPNGENPISISSSERHTMIITDKGNLYAWGDNSYGQLGLGNTSRQLTPQLVNLPDEEKPISISLGIYNSMIITNKGNLYSWGRNLEGQLGIGNTNNQITLQLVTLPNKEKPISIYSGNQHSMVITDKGNLYAWGNNNHGQLGIGNTTNQSTPQLVTLPNGEKPISVDLGNSSSMVITDKGNLYAWGENRWGQLGIGNKLDQEVPQLVTLPNEEKAKFVSAGAIHTMVITDKSNLYAWGYNGHGELGIGTTIDQSTPQIVTMPNWEKPISITLGGYHSMVTSDKGNSYVFGNNLYGQLGISNKINQLTPIKATLP